MAPSNKRSPKSEYIFWENILIFRRKQMKDSFHLIKVLIKGGINYGSL